MEKQTTKRIMIDLEIMGINSIAAIVSIGCDSKTGVTGDEFEIVINLRSSAYYS